MNIFARILFSVFSCFFFVSPAVAQQNSTIIFSGTGNNFTLNGGETLVIQSGNFTGSINVNGDATITIAAGASFRPSSISGFRNSNITNYGTAVLPSFTIGSGSDSARIRNYGSMQFTGLLLLNGNNTLFNGRGASAHFAQPLVLNNASWSNEGSMQFTDLTTSPNSRFYNRGRLGAGNITFGGSDHNDGMITITGATQVTSPSGFTNNCTLLSGQSFTNTTQTNNNGLLWLNGSSVSDFRNNSSIVQSENGTIRAKDFTNSSSFTGAGQLYLTGTTINTGTFGDGALPRINVHDLTRTGTGFFDVQTVSPKSDVYTTSIYAPDTLNTRPVGCAAQFQMVSAIALPASLLRFSARKEGSGILIAWQTSSEKDVEQFIVEKSADGVHFLPLQTVAPANKGTAVTNYGIKDAQPASANYYRLRTIDRNGSFAYSSVVIVREEEKSGMQVAPNPFVQHLQIRFNSPAGGEGVVSLTDAFGRPVHRSVSTLVKGNQTISLPGLDGLAKGMYLVQVHTSNGVYTAKVVK